MDSLWCPSVNIITHFGQPGCGCPANLVFCNILHLLGKSGKYRQYYYNV